ncbi:MAG: gliding motility protein GldN [Chitinophagaceae bacterium]|nr:gliding motility protein GldN [Chitinophagaceae bacterium]
MKRSFVKCAVLSFFLGGFTFAVNAQNVARATKTDTTPVDTVVVPSIPDSVPIPVIKKSLRNDNAIERNLVRDRVPLAYENLREDDAVYRHKVWRDIDTREKINIAFRYSANEDAGNQRFISVLLKAVQDGPDNGGVTAFSAIDDRFTTPMTRAEVAKQILGEPVTVPIYDEDNNIVEYKTTMPEINLDSFYKFRIKEEVIFDKESSRLFWRVLGIAPLKRIITSSGVDLGESEMFWVYYPDIRATFAKYEVYNGKNYGARMSWEELFESRMFYGRIVKSTIDNPFNLYLDQQPGLANNRILQLLESENIKDKIFNYEQNLWSY